MHSNLASFKKPKIQFSQCQDAQTPNKPVSANIHNAKLGFLNFITGCFDTGCFGVRPYNDLVKLSNLLQ
jgi:hypothetical protein